MQKTLIFLLITMTFVWGERFERDDQREIVTDRQTHLQWQDSVEAKIMKKSYEDAIEYCDALILGGYDDWRLPFSDELSTIIDPNKCANKKSEVMDILGEEECIMIDDTFKNMPENGARKYWKLSSWQGNKKSEIAQCMDFTKNDEISCAYGKKEKLNVRCVRGQQLNPNEKLSDYYDKDDRPKRILRDALYTALDKNDYTKLDLFLSKKENKKYLNELYRGHSLLGIAYDNKPLIRYLIQHGADRHIRDFKGYTPLEELMFRPCRKHGDIVPCESLKSDPKELKKLIKILNITDPQELYRLRREHRGNPKADIELVKLLGGDEHTRPYIEPKVQKIEGKIWEYIPNTRDTETNRAGYNEQNASVYCENLKIEDYRFRLPRCSELDSLASQEKTIPFVYHGIPVDGLYVDFHKTPDITPNNAHYWCTKDGKTLTYSFETKKAKPNRYKALVKCIAE